MMTLSKVFKKTAVETFGKIGNVINGKALRNSK